MMASKKTYMIAILLLAVCVGIYGLASVKNNGAGEGSRLIVDPYRYLNDYAARVQMEARYFLELSQNLNTRSDAFLYTKGYLERNSTDDYFKSVERAMLDAYEEKDKPVVNQIIGVNNEINILIGNLYDYLNRHDDNDFAKKWGDIQKRLQAIYPLLVSGSSSDVTLYNVSNNPSEFVNNKELHVLLEKVSQIINDIYGLIRSP
ncbi:hypothetical protein [Paenibacillus flagellatus]|uniref:Uncharacterized protein n=1 Tax=Paenibacillus flagellatus TaxID=2211139 RepID=A0A2V5JZP5_9BACL|nr:hypothetical protein [Paenibacillus flagellatus]PYI50814.1 hypothetical protein DLM86_27475 [Paenibacillus flagellatus]